MELILDRLLTSSTVGSKLLRYLVPRIKRRSPTLTHLFDDGKMVNTANRFDLGSLIWCFSCLVLAYCKPFEVEPAAIICSDTSCFFFFTRESIRRKETAGLLDFYTTPLSSSIQIRFGKPAFIYPFPRCGQLSRRESALLLFFSYFLLLIFLFVRQKEIS